MYAAIVDKGIEEVWAKRPPNWERVEAAKRSAHAAQRGQWLLELREAYGLSRAEASEHANVSESAVSKIERGDIEQMRIDAIRRYVEALGGDLRVEVELGDQRFRIA